MLIETCARLGAFLFVAAAVAQAGEVTLTATRDNTLYIDPMGLTSNGLGDNFVVGRTGPTANEPVRRAVLGFDLAGTIPAGSTISSVELNLTLRMTSAGPFPIEVHRVATDWGEGTSLSNSGMPDVATAGDATWIHSSSPVLWSTPGGDFDVAVSASLSVDQPGVYTWASTSKLVADAQDMLDNSAVDFGWILIGNEVTSNSAKLFSSKDHPAPLERPTLVVRFTAPPVSYCTAGTTTGGCHAVMGSSGTPSLSNAGPFTLTATGVDGNKNGIFFYSIAGRSAAPWGNSQSLLCVKAPTQRMNPPGGSGGTNGQCDGSYARDWNAYVAANPNKAINRALLVGTLVDAQAWFRDGGSTGPVGSKGTALSDGLEFCVSP